MSAPPCNRRVAIFVALATGVVIVLAFVGWPQPARGLEFAALALAALLIAGLTNRRTNAPDAAVMPPVFVVEFTTLLLVGAPAAVVVTGCASVARCLAHSSRLDSLCQRALNIVTAVAATLAAGVVHQTLGGTLGSFVWPWQALPIAAAVATYCLVRIASADVIAPLVTKIPANSPWLKRLERDCPSYFIGASLAVAAAEVIDHRMWEMVLVAALPLYFTYRSYCDYMMRLEDERCRRTVIEVLDEGMAVVDGNGRVTLWDDVVERIVGCRRERALEQLLLTAVPTLRTTELPRAIDEVLASRTPRTVTLRLSSGSSAPVLQVKLLPGHNTVTLLWSDVTERTREDEERKRNEQRLALAAEGANDGLWEWNLRSQTLYVSGRWRSMIGLAAAAGVTRPEDWFKRVHPDDAARLKEALKAYLSGDAECFQHQHRIRHEDGSYRWFLCRGIVARDAGRRPIRLAGSLSDRTEHAVTQEQLRSAGFVDPLTGLCNRSVFVEGLGRRLDEFKQHRGGQFAVLFLDLDRFKIVNDSLGHLVGDELLVAVSRRLESCLRPEDVLARLGGDEFAILLNRLNDEQQANAIAFRIQETLSAPISIGGREVFTSVSIGIAPGMSKYSDPDEMMRDADTAMYHAKSRGKARHELFDADMHARAQDRLGLENDLRHAVNNNDFEMHYQPIVSLNSRMCVGFEALVRWTRNGEAVSPATFIPVAEELGLIEPLGTWVLEESCRTFADWQRRFPDAGLDCITVNVSSRQLMQHNFLHLVEKAVRHARLNPHNLRIEITETALMDSPGVAAGVLRELRNFGVKIYLDDFGTGYSSLSHLHKLPVDALKIDRSFVKSLLLPDRPAIVESILALARTLNTSVVAEGIERDVQARELARLGCTHAQGFLFSRPLSTQSAEELLIANAPLGPAQEEDKPEVACASVPLKWPIAGRTAAVPNPPISSSVPTACSA